MFRRGILFLIGICCILCGKNAIICSATSFSRSEYSFATTDIAVKLQTEKNTTDPNKAEEFLKLISFPLVVDEDEDDAVLSYDGSNVEVLAEEPTKKRNKNRKIERVKIGDIVLQVIYRKKKIIDLVLAETDHSVFSRSGGTAKAQGPSVVSSVVAVALDAAPAQNDSDCMEDCAATVQDLVDMVDDLCDFGKNWKKWRRKWKKRNKTSSRRVLDTPVVTAAVSRIARLSADMSCKIANFLENENDSQSVREWLCGRLGSGCCSANVKICPSDGSCIDQDDCCPGERKCVGETLLSRTVCVPVNECCPGCIRCPGETAPPPAGCYEKPCCPAGCSDFLLGCDCGKTVRGCCSSTNGIEVAESNLECVTKELAV